MILSSFIIALVGVTGTAIVVGYLNRPAPGKATESAWFLGLGSLAFAWLVALLGLLGQTPKEVLDTPLPPSVLVSSALALLGVIFTDAIHRRLPSWGITASTRVSWSLGVAAFVPAWIVALWFLR